VVGPQFDWPADAPIGLFEVTDARICRHWEFQSWDDGGFALCPLLFADSHFVSEFLDYDPDVLASFRHVRRLLESEFSSDLLREVIRGDRPLDALEMAGDNVALHWSAWTIHNRWAVSTPIYRQDMAQGLVAYTATPDKLALWASLVLNTGLVNA